MDIYTPTQHKNYGTPFQVFSFLVSIHSKKVPNFLIKTLYSHLKSQTFSLKQSYISIFIAINVTLYQIKSNQFLKDEKRANKYHILVGVELLAQIRSLKMRNEDQQTPKTRRSVKRKKESKVRIGDLI